MSPRRHLLTGAGSGMGEELARRLVERDDEVLAVARTADRGAEMEQAVPGLATVVADLSDAADIDRLAATLPDRLDSLVHAAGVVELAPVSELSAATWHDQLSVNLVAPAVLTRLCLPALRAARGSVVFVNSSAGRAAKPTWSAYAASKHGLKALADSLAGEEDEIRVSTVFPGRTATAMQEKVHRQEGKDYDAEAWIRPGTVADLLLTILDLPVDAVLPELVVTPS